MNIWTWDLQDINIFSKEMIEAFFLMVNEQYNDRIERYLRFGDIGFEIPLDFSMRDLDNSLDIPPDIIKECIEFSSKDFDTLVKKLRRLLKFSKKIKEIVKMRKCNILVITGGRSNEALVKPIIKLLESQEWCNLLTFSVVPGTFGNNYQFVDDALRNSYKPEYQPDLVYIVGDRIEMFAASIAAYHNNTPICHYGGGIIEGYSTFDEVQRHSITMMATIEFVETEEASLIVKKIWESIERIDAYSYMYIEPDELDEIHIHVVGNVYLDNIELDESLVPSELYDLILVNYEPLKDKETNYKNLEYASHQIKENYEIYINSNPDGDFEDFIEKENRKNYRDLPRPQFLGLLKNCQRYITNSSSAYYEAPLFLKPEQIIHIGERNKNRSTRFKNMEKGASDKIIMILKKWWLNKNEEDI